MRGVQWQTSALSHVIQSNMSPQVWSMIRKNGKKMLIGSSSARQLASSATKCKTSSKSVCLTRLRHRNNRAPSY